MGANAEATATANLDRIINKANHYVQYNKT